MAGEACGVLVGQLEGLAIKARGGPALAQVVEGDGQVVGDVGVPGCQAVGLEVGLLRFGPALLGGQGVTEGEVRADGVGLAGEAVLQAAFGLHRVVALGAGEAGQGRRVEGVSDEGAAEELPGELVLPLLQRNGAEAIEDVRVVRGAHQDFPVERPGKGKIACAVGLVGGGEGGGKRSRLGRGPVDMDRWLQRCRLAPRCCGA